MKLDTSALFEVGGFECISLIHEPGSAAFRETDARAVFVTPENVQRARRAGRVDVTGGPNLRYGDLLLKRLHENGRVEGLKYPAGKDAGILITVSGADGFECRIPLTGAHSLSARRALMAVGVRGHKLNDGGKTALAGISSIFDMVSSNPDPARFGGQLIGQAFLGKLLDRVGRVRLSITEEEFGRRARADLTRSRIGMINQMHPDAIGGSITLPEVMRDIGVRGGNDAPPRYGASRSPREGLEAHVGALQATAGIFDQLTKTSLRRMDIRQITPGECNLISDEIPDNLLTGDWCDRARAKIEAAIATVHRNGSAQAALYAIEGLDMLVVREGEDSGWICSWPSSDRIPLTDLGDEYLLNISPQEIPSEKEIIRLQLVLGQLDTETILEHEGGRGSVG
ncbi:hypothetical protein [Paracoccus sp. ME4]|uniref:hypothetical protein n=1 Tax=Paracoccus sp. ME4 TaxID=3138066 RepID=UPI00398A6B00